MQCVRVTVKHNSVDPADDLRWAARLRRDLWAHSPVEIDPDSPRHGTHRDEQKNAFFEFATDRLPEVRRVLQEYGYTARVEATVVQDEKGTECVNCGNITPRLVTVCPSCQFRDIPALPALQSRDPAPGVHPNIRGSVQVPDVPQAGSSRSSRTRCSTATAITSNH